MKQLKKDVIRELRRLKEDKINPTVFDNIKAAKSEKQIAMVLLNFYMPDIFATCFMPEQFSMYWKEWSFKDYFKVAKKFVSIDKETVETSLNVLKEDEALYEMDSVIYDFFQDRQAAEFCYQLNPYSRKLERSQCRAQSA